MEAKRATELDPENAEGWLFLGTTEQRLEHPVEALSAFRKYLSLNPPADKAAAVRSRIAEMEVAADKKTKSDETAKTARYGKRGKGPILGFSPLYKPNVSVPTQLGHGISSGLIAGWRMDDMGSLIFRYSSGLVPALDIPSGSTTINATNLPAKLFSFGLDINITLNDPFEKLGGFQFFIPVSLSIFANWITHSSGLLTNIGGDLGSGAGVRYYTGTFIVVDAVFLYHLSLPLMNISSGSNSATNPTTGLNIHGGVNGPELRFSVTFLL